MRVFAVDAVMEHDTAYIFGGLLKGTRFFDGTCLHRFQMRKLDPVLVERIDVVVQVEIDPRHVGATMASRGFRP